MAKTMVSVIVPIRNEEHYIANCLASLLKQTYSAEAYEVIVVDGRSSDRSREIVENLCRAHANLRCIDNPAGIVPCAMNIGIRRAKGEVIIRADGHSIYPADYVENCVRYLEQTGADNVGGPWLTVPANESFGARLVAAILTSPFGVGNSQFRINPADGFVDTVPFGAFRRNLFDRAGMYNEKLVRNQDNELNARIREAGGKIYQAAALTTKYHPVAGFWKLLTLTFRTSQWHLLTMRENSHAMSSRHLIPAFFVIAIVALSIASVFNYFALFALALALLLHLSSGLLVAMSTRSNCGLAIRGTLPFACLCFHISYGLGTLAGIRYLLKAPPYAPIREGQPVER
jgi:glycosyltransferase involved in cell wall biosynthesis